MGPLVPHAPRLQHQHQDGGGHRGLPAHRVRVQQGEVSGERAGREVCGRIRLWAKGMDADGVSLFALHDFVTPGDSTPLSALLRRNPTSPNSIVMIAPSRSISRPPTPTPSLLLPFSTPAWLHRHPPPFFLLDPFRVHVIISLLLPSSHSLST